MSGWLREVAHCCDSTRLAGQEEHTQVSRAAYKVSHWLSLLLFLGVESLLKKLTWACDRELLTLGCF